MSNFFNKCKEILNRLSSVDVEDASGDYIQYVEKKDIEEKDIEELKLAERAVVEIVHNLDPINLSRKASVKVQNGGTRAKTGRATGSKSKENTLTHNSERSQEEHTR
jgi:hypothetical protein